MGLTSCRNNSNCFPLVAPHLVEVVPQGEYPLHHKKKAQPLMPRFWLMHIFRRGLPKTAYGPSASFSLASEAMGRI